MSTYPKVELPKKWNSPIHNTSSAAKSLLSGWLPRKDPASSKKLGATEPDLPANWNSPPSSSQHGAVCLQQMIDGSLPVQLVFQPQLTVASHSFETFRIIQQFSDRLAEFLRIIA